MLANSASVLEGSCGLGNVTGAYINKVVSGKWVKFKFFGGNYLFKCERALWLKGSENVPSQYLFSKIKFNYSLQPGVVKCVAVKSHRLHIHLWLLEYRGAVTVTQGQTVAYTEHLLPRENCTVAFQL